MRSSPSPKQFLLPKNLLDEWHTFQGDISIGDDVWIGANSVILKDVTISSHAIIGAGSVVTKDIPEYAVATGVPARIIKWRSRGESADKKG